MKKVSSSEDLKKKQKNDSHYYGCGLKKKSKKELCSFHVASKMKTYAFSIIHDPREPQGSAGLSPTSSQWLPVWSALTPAAHTTWSQRKHIFLKFLSREMSTHRILAPEHMALTDLLMKSEGDRNSRLMERRQEGI